MLITDSRGKDLEPLLLKYNTRNYHWDIRVFPGATLQSIERKLAKYHAKADIIIVLAGICNFTSKIRTRTRSSIEYKVRRTEETKTTINSILDKFGRKTHICTITPADLSKQPTPDTSSAEEQSNLLEDIEATNTHIKDLNITRDLPTIDIAINSYTKSLKKQGGKKKKIIKFTSKDLPDGIHPSASLKDTWAKYLTKCTNNLADKLLRHDEPEPSTEETSSDEENWDFKRPRFNKH